MTRLPVDAVRGALAFSITPFRDDLEVDLPRLEAHVDALVEAGLRTIVIAGNTGEFYSLSSSEIESLTAVAVRALGGRAIVVTGVGHGTHQATDGARAAERAGASAVMVHTPAHPYTTDDGYLEYVAAIVRSVGIPVIPYLKGIDPSRDTIRRLVSLEGIAAVKYARPDPVALAQLVVATQDDADVAWVCGIAERWAPFFWAAGAVGFTSGVVNVEAAPSIELWRLLEAGERVAAMRLWSAITPIEALRARHNDGANVAVLKEALRLLGRPVGPVRPPSSGLDPETRQDLPAALERLRTAMPAARA